MSRRGASKRASRNTSKDKRKRRPQHEQQQHHPQEDTSSGVGSSICGRWRRRRFPTSIASTAEHQYRLPHMPEEKGVGDGGGRGGGLIARRGRKKAGVVTPAALFSALCAALLLVGALSFSRSQLLPSVATAARRTSAAEVHLYPCPSPTLLPLPLCTLNCVEGSTTLPCARRYRRLLKRTKW